MAIDTRPEPQADELPPDPNRAGSGRGSKRRRVLRALGTYLITIGLLTIGFVAYEYWGTGYLTQRAQATLRNKVADQGGFVVYGGVPDDRGAVKPQKHVFPGEAIGEIRIPRISLDMLFVQGSDRASLNKGPGHYAHTPFPGQGGNVAIAGHRTTYLHPFWALDEVRKGDRVTLLTSNGVFVYKVLWVKIVEPTDTSVIAPTTKPSLTLTTCNPRFSARERLIVRAEQISGPGLNAAIPGSTS
jgi:sortase A